MSNPAPEETDKAAAPIAKGSDRPEDYLGSETCRACHEDQFTSFSKTAHAHLAKAGWKNEGCESCHGSGKAHVEGGGDKTKIRTFENESPKQISENCLDCHAGKEEHNNYARRALANDVVAPMVFAALVEAPSRQAPGSPPKDALP